MNYENLLCTCSHSTKYFKVFTKTLNHQVPLLLLVDDRNGTSINDFKQLYDGDEVTYITLSQIEEEIGTLPKPVHDDRYVGVLLVLYYAYTHTNASKIMFVDHDVIFNKTIEQSIFSSNHSKLYYYSKSISKGQFTRYIKNKHPDHLHIYNVAKDYLTVDYTNDVYLPIGTYIYFLKSDLDKVNFSNIVELLHDERLNNVKFTKVSTFFEHLVACMFSSIYDKDLVKINKLCNINMGSTSYKKIITNYTTIDNYLNINNYIDKFSQSGFAHTALHVDKDLSYADLYKYFSEKDLCY